MKDDEYRTIKITKKAYEELSAFRDEVYAGGVDSLPPDLKPEGDRRLITLGILVEMSVRAARKRFQRNT
jgi:hypothetical protein